MTFNKVNTYDWYSQRLQKVDDLTGYKRHDRMSAMQRVMETEGLITGLIYQRK